MRRQAAVAAEIVSAPHRNGESTLLVGVGRAWRLSAHNRSLCAILSCCVSLGLGLGLGLMIMENRL
eukprot:SAG11_NODE_31899_length_288_cov_0.809524_1_plen_65_part_10